MFYSHEILTSRKGGVATVWLVATLGSRSNLKKVNRKAIFDVNVPATCRIIIEPEAPMALRLQSNLLYGVSRVFSQQCGYILSDAQIAQSNIRTLIKAVKTSELDPNAGKARADQIMLQDDPAFLPDFAFPGLDIDLSALDLSADDSSRRSSILSPHSLRSSQSSHQGADDSVLGLIIPSSSVGGAGDIGGFVLPEENISSVQRDDRLGRLLDDEDEGFNIDPGFSIDAEGNIIEEGPPSASAAPSVGVRLGSDFAGGGRIRQSSVGEAQLGQLGQPEPMNLDIGMQRMDDDDVFLAPAEPFPEMVPPGPALPQPSLEERRESESSEFVEAPLQRKRRPPKELPSDERQELHNAELASWKDNYVANMAEASEAKNASKASALAKKNAAFWVLGSGIGGVGAGLGTSKLKSPLDMFAGDALMEALTGIKMSTAGQKRGRDDQGDQTSDSEARRTRPREDEGEQIGRGDGMILNDDETMVLDPEDGTEIGRHAVAPLEDPSFPWNVSSNLGSRQGSIVRGHGFASSIGGFPTSAGAPSSLPGIGVTRPNSFDRRASRVPSASPLVGHGRQRYSSLELPMADDDDVLMAGGGSDDQAREAFEHYGPGAAVDTQTAADSQWVRSTLDHEAGNFLAFVETKIAAKQPPEDEEEDELSGDAQPRFTSITFEEMLPPANNSKVVASQALYHILALATKSLIKVQQDVGSEDISIRLPASL